MFQRCHLSLQAFHEDRRFRQVMVNCRSAENHSDNRRRKNDNTITTLYYDYDDDDDDDDDIPSTTQENKILAR